MVRKTVSELHAGEWVQVRSKAEILQTLDKNGQLEGLPFMPEMFASCGARFRVFKRAHKTCDPPNGKGGRRMLHAVHLEGIRCTGEAHDGCEARCLIFWKEAWLTRIDSDIQPAVEIGEPLPQNRLETSCLCTEQDVIAGTRVRPKQTDDITFICQSTQLPQATESLHWWDPRQYAEDYTSGNVHLSQMVGTFLVFLCNQVASAGVGFGSAMRWVYDRIQQMRGGTPYPWRLGKIQAGAKTPSSRLDVQPGELVRVRPYQQILTTIDEAGNNRGMSFDPEMVPYCGGTYRVLDRIRKIINEKTGKMQHLKNDCIMLDSVVCRACYSKYRRFCPRSIYSYWREIWLERIEAK